jgi:CubicO group peptidase (beta-lactamase class C family)
MRFRYAFALMLLGSAAEAQRATLPADARAKADAIFARFARTDSPGCAVGASIANEPVFSAAYGMADLEHDAKITAETIFEAGSVSKQFTAAAVLLLARQGKLSLEDSVRKYLPELPAVDEPVKIRHLLNHTSGLRDWGSVEAIAGWPRTTRAYTNEHVLDIMSRQLALNYAPGAAYSYTNSGYNLMALMVGRVSGKSLAAYTREALFAPLGMNSTSWRDDFQRVVKGRAIAYWQNYEGVSQLMPFENVYGNGGLLTTVGDLLRWNANFASGRVGGKEFVAEQHVRGVLTDGRTIGYAAGLMIGTYKGLNVVSHSGTTAGYNAWLGRYPDQELSVAVLCNTSAANGTMLGHAMAEVFLGGAVKNPGAGVKVESAQAGSYRSMRDGSVREVGAGADASNLRFEAGGRMFVVTADGDVLYERVEGWKPSAADLTAFAGEYTSDEAEVTYTAAVVDGALQLRRRPGTRITLTPVYRDGFRGSLGTVRFVRDGSGAVREMSIGESRVWDLRLKKR